VPAHRLHPDEGVGADGVRDQGGGRAFAKFGVHVGEPQLDFGAANQWKDGVVKQMTGGVASLFKANGVEWVKGTAASRTRTRSRSRAGRTSTFKQAIIATGSFPLRPPIEGLDSPRCVDSTGLLSQTEVPRRLVVLGGGSSASSSRRSSSASAAR
jgi:dihydrolipoamide dehydrogenase